MLIFYRYQPSFTRSCQQFLGDHSKLRIKSQASVQIASVHPLFTPVPLALVGQCRHGVVWQPEPQLTPACTQPSHNNTLADSVTRQKWGPPPGCKGTRATFFMTETKEKWVKFSLFIWEGKCQVRKCLDSSSNNFVNLVQNNWKVVLYQI